LKQAPWAWYTWLNDYLLFIGFHASKVNTSLFILSMDSDIFYIFVYVDDILLTRSNSILLHHLIQLLNLKFKLWYLGAAYFYFYFWIELHPTSMGNIVWQDKYIHDRLH